MKQAPQRTQAAKRRILLVNLVVLAVWVGLTFLQASRYVASDDLFWMSSWWFLVYFLLVFGSNLAVLRGGWVKRSLRSFLAVGVLTVAWAGSLAFCAQVLGIYFEI